MTIFLSTGRAPDGAQPAGGQIPAGRPVLFLIADTGGGHRAAAEAVAQRLASLPGNFIPVLLDPLAGPAAPWLLRQVIRLYGPAIRHLPRAWAAAYRLTDTRAGMVLLRAALLRAADRPVRAAFADLAPVAVVSCHPLLTATAAGAARRAPGHVPAVTVITDLVTAHRSWRHPGADRIVAPSAAVRDRCRRAGLPPASCAELGLPVRAAFAGGPPSAAARRALRRRLGVPAGRFLVVVTGGGEGAGGLAWVVRALLRGAPDAGVVAICGRNDRLRRRLARLAGGSGGRLAVTGFVGDMASWLCCADLVVSKPGPGTIAEAACCGVPMLLTAPAGGQEAGNAEWVIGAGAGRHARRPAELLREVARLRGDPAALARMRAAATRLAQPEAASSTARLIAGLAAGQAWQPAAGTAAAASRAGGLHVRG